ncbi:MAG: hypothetical protein NTV49_06920 [Kiritimatiellaeota bacterium]|nr:hypothetical protein [Kiritimatiellota bacterium]
MKQTIFIWCAVLLMLKTVCGQVAPAPAANDPGLDEVRKQFEASFRALLRQERDTAKLLQKNYLEGLIALEDSLQSAGNQLSAVLVVSGEKTRFEQAGDIPESVLASELPALRKLQNAWRAQAAGLPREQAQKIVAASERYLQNLANLRKVRESHNDTRGVDEVKAETDQLLSNNRVREALGLLKTSVPPAHEPTGSSETSPAGAIVEVGGYKFYPPGKEPRIRNLQPLRVECPSDLRLAQFHYELRASAVTDRTSRFSFPRIVIAAKNCDIPAGSKLVLEYFIRSSGRPPSVSREKPEDIALPKIARGQAFTVDGNGFIGFTGLIISLYDEEGKLLFQQYGPSIEAVSRKALN